MQTGVLVLGATRGTGLEVCRGLRARQVPVTALVRPGSADDELARLGVAVIRGDALDERAVAQACATPGTSAIVNTLGGRRGERPRPDVEGTRIMISAAIDAGIDRVVLVTAIGAGDSQSAVSPKVLEVLGEVLALKTEAEALLTSSGLDYTVLRPGGMNSEPATGRAVRTEDHQVMGVIGRADLAALVIECLDDRASVGKIYHTIDPGIQQAAPLQRGESFPPGAVKP